ncbi:hypothetical protein QAD02_002874 [Eretmocerus hayati]|uniref:Uncharacterized protein n=1 Tax=Eretmocerus hayati TaxID=131215 RepID=A0ACC2NKB2_9HYME|nr:hypothetical protein QAD02_002874 [Eretmocerus hayati]
MPRCTECSLSFTYVNYLYFHIKDFHSLKLERFRCQESNCSRDFPSWDCFRKHLINYHEFKTHSLKSVNNVVCENLKAEQIEVKEVEHFQAISQWGSISKSPLTASQAFEGKINEKKNPNPRANGAYIKVNKYLKIFEKTIDDIIYKQTLELYADRQLPQVQAQRMIDRTKILVNTVTESFTTMIQLLEDEFPIDTIVKNSSQKLFRTILSKLKEFDTHYERSAMMARNGLIKPVAVIVGSTVEEKCKDNQIVKELVPLNVYRIPLKQTFKTFFERPGVLKAILKYMTHLYSDNNVLSNLIQGEGWRKKMICLYIDKIVIPFLIYLGEFEINDPLGSHRGIHKLFGIYCSFLILPPRVQSQAWKYFSCYAVLLIR